MMRIIFTLFLAMAIFSSTTFGDIVCNKPNEEYQCGSACQTTCQHLGEPCPYVNIRCNEGCYCKEGYARDCRGSCIPIELCPTDKCNRSRRTKWFSKYF